MTTPNFHYTSRRRPNYRYSRASSLPLTLLLLLLTFVSSQENTSSNNVCAFQPNNKMRAWHCHGRSQKELVERLRQAKIVTSTPTQQVMEAVDRQFYIPQNPYQDSPQPIAKSQTISAPHMHAHVLEEILPVLQKQAHEQQHPGEAVKILDVGCGSGYLTACFGRWFQASPAGVLPEEGETDQGSSSNSNTNTAATPATSSSILPFRGRVFGMDIHADLVELSTQNIRKADADLLDKKIVTLKVGNGWQGWPEEAPFDAIHVGAAAPTFPVALALQLRKNGVLIVPVGPTSGVQTLLRVQRIDTTGTFRQDFALTELLGVRYVPLVQGPD